MVLRALRKKFGFSERDLAQLAGISRETLRRIERGDLDYRLDTLNKIAASVHCSLQCLFIPEQEGICDYSTVSVSLKVVHDGFNSWKIHFMELVDEFRRTMDQRLVLLPPVTTLPLQLKALLAAIVSSLCTESSMEPPLWAQKIYFLECPWFIADMES